MVNTYTFVTFVDLFDTEKEEIISNPFKFTGQFYDSEIGQYYLRARQYDPHIARFTARDPIFGKFGEPLSLHKYLYCQNEPVDRFDPFGLLYTPAGGPFYDWKQTQHILYHATDWIRERGLLVGPWKAFGPFGEDFRGEFDYKHYKGDPVSYGFELRTIGRGNGLLGVEPGGYEYLMGSEFTNYLVGYSLYYNYKLLGEAPGRLFGHAYAFGEWFNEAWFKHDRDDDKWWRFWDAPSSRYWVSRGTLAANLSAQHWYEKYGTSVMDNIELKLLKGDETRIRYFLNFNEAMYFSELSE